MIQTLFGLYSMTSLATNYSVSNMPNIYNLLISILSTNIEIDKKKEIVQLIKLHCGMTVYDGFKAYVMKKYAVDAEIVKLLHA